MKAIRIILLFIITGIVELGGAGNVQAQTAAVITGALQKGLNCKINYDVFEDVIFVKTDDIIDSVVDGTFHLTTPAFSKIAYVNLAILSDPYIIFEYFLVEPGDSIHISMGKNGLEFSGKGYEKWQYQYAENKLRPMKIRNVPRDEVPVYFDYLCNRQTEALKHLEEYKGKISPFAWSIMKADAIGIPEDKKLKNLLMAMGAESVDPDHRKLFREKTSATPYGLTPNDTTALSFSYIYAMWGRARVDCIMSNAYSADNYTAVKLHGYIKQHYTGLMRDRLLLWNLSVGLDFDGMSPALDKCINDYLAHCTTPKYAKMLNQQYLTVKKLSKGMPAYNFELTDTSGKKVRLSDFKGKLVYLDFWASWCHPCREEMKSAPALHEKLKDEKDMVFIYISMDASVAAWKKAIQQDKIEGVHVLADNATNGKLAKEYMIFGVPRYMIIDRKGNFLENNALRPSENQIYSILVNYLRGTY